MAFEKGIFHALGVKTSKPEVIIASLIVVGLSILGGFGIQRMSVYWGHKEADYYNPNYATIPGNIDNVVIHATFGFLSFICVPLWIIVAYFFSSSKCAMYSISTVTVLFLLATVATVPLIQGTIIGNVSGTATVITAVVWAIWWIVCCVASGVQYFRGRLTESWGAWAWWVRFLGGSVFGFVLTPIFFALRGNHAGSALALIPILLLHYALSEWIVRRGVNQVESDEDGVVVTDDKQMEKESSPVLDTERQNGGSGFP